MTQGDPFLTRRDWLRGTLALGTAAFLTSGLFAEELNRTPSLQQHSAEASRQAAGFRLRINP